MAVGTGLPGGLGPGPFGKASFPLDHPWPNINKGVQEALAGVVEEVKISAMPKDRQAKALLLTLDKRGSLGPE